MEEYELCPICNVEFDSDNNHAECRQIAIDTDDEESQLAWCDNCESPITDDHYCSATEYSEEDVAGMVRDRNRANNID